MNRIPAALPTRSGTVVTMIFLLEFRSGNLEISLNYCHAASQHHSFWSGIMMCLVIPGSQQRLLRPGQPGMDIWFRHQLSSVRGAKGSGQRFCLVQNYFREEAKAASPPSPRESAPRC